MPPSRKRKRFSEADYQAILDQTAKPAALKSKTGTGDVAIVGADEPVKQKKRRGVKETPIMDSVLNSKTIIEASPSHVSMAFHGARLFSLNELFAIQQYRKYIVFAYKRAWKDRVRAAINSLGANKPRLEGACKVTYFRQGSKRVDQDSLAVMFKYIVDAMKDDDQTAWTGIIVDDDPLVIRSDEKIQSKGEPIVGIRIELIFNAKPMENLSCNAIFDKANPMLEPAPPPEGQKNQRHAKKDRRQNEKNAGEAK